MPLDNLEFRSPVTEVPRRDGTSLPLLFHQVWQRRLSNLWAYVRGYSIVVELDFPNTPGQDSSELAVALPGVKEGDVVQIGAPILSMNNAAFFDGFVNGPGEVIVRFNNFSAGPINPAIGNFTILVRRA